MLTYSSIKEKIMTDFNGSELVTVTLTRNELADIMSALLVSAHDFRKNGAKRASTEEKALREKIRSILKAM